MNLSTIEMRHLRYFVGVAEAGSFRAAAERLHITQPPLTRQVQQLEEMLGTELFVRRSRGVELTAAGRMLLDDARNILILTEQALTRSQLAGRGELGRLDVGVFGSAGLDFVPRIIQDFRRLYPQVEVVLHSLDRDEQIKALSQRRLTVGFNRFFGDEIGLEWEVILTESMHVAVPALHPYAELKELAFSALEGQPLILYPRKPRPGFIDHLMRMFHTQNILPKVEQEVDDVVTAVALVAAGVGLCLVVDSACNLSLPGVVYVPLRKQDKATFNLCLIRRSDDHSPLLEAFIKVARVQRGSKNGGLQLIR
ncbi:LysR family transcriptional regulator [Eoetvoesiella caeni]